MTDVFLTVLCFTVAGVIACVNYRMRKRAFGEFVHAIQSQPEGLDRLCVCGHNIYAHDDFDFEPHECRRCRCSQFLDAL